MEHSVCIISEDLSYPIDEGIKKFAHSLIRGLSSDNRVLGLSVSSRGRLDTPHTVDIRVNRLFLSLKLRAELRRFRPGVVCYVPSPSATIFSFIRSRLLKLYYRRARVVMVSLQPRRYGWLTRYLIPRLAPDIVFVQHEPVMRQLRSLGCRAQLISSGVDLDKFTPVSPEGKVSLRNKYGLDPAAFTTLHVGHITEGRNIGLLAEIRRGKDAQVVLVGSSLIHKDRVSLDARLRGEGVIVLDKYYPDIEELYQLSDCYVFPVFSDQACIGTPLSILEAMACNLPVVSVRYGSLPALFHEGQGLYFADTPEELLREVAAVTRLNGCNTREKVAPYSWPNIARSIIESSDTTEVKG
jgi:glycosyltransferase involved in cell wall biosynthesis